MTEGTVLALHQRGLRGDQSAIEEIVSYFLPVLQRKLQRAFRQASSDLIADAVEDALLEYAARPQNYDPTRGVPLERFLFRASWRNLLNSIDSARRRRAREEEYAQLASRGTPNSAAGIREIGVEVQSVAKKLALAANRRELLALRFWIEGERKTQAFVDALELWHLPPSQQQMEVKRFKDRLVKRLRRMWRDSVAVCSSLKPDA